jgi:hypothetical protein
MMTEREERKRTGMHFRDGCIEAHTCDFCNLVSLCWVRWENWQGERHHFCDDDCLAQWLERLMRETIAEVWESFGDEQPPWLTSP